MSAKIELLLKYCDYLIEHSSDTSNLKLIRSKIVIISALVKLKDSASYLSDIKNFTIELSDEFDSIKRHNKYNSFCLRNNRFSSLQSCRQFIRDKSLNLLI